MSITTSYINLGALKLRMDNTAEHSTLTFPEAFKNFIRKGSVEDEDINILVRALASEDDLLDDSSPVSHVPAEIETLPADLYPPSFHWEIRKHIVGYRIRTWSHNGNNYTPLYIDFNPYESKITLHASIDNDSIFPLGYPAGSLLVYLCSTLSGGILIHASVVRYEDKGFLFTGPSGIGKTTMSHLWKDAGAELIHDDRVLLRFKDGKWLASSTPVNNGDLNVSVSLDHVFILNQAPANALKQLSGMDAYTSVLENCIQHHYDEWMINSLLEAVENFTNTVPVSQLDFQKSNTVPEFILSETAG